MNINFFPFLVLEACLLIAVIAMFAWRQAVARGEDDTIHVLHGATSQQTSVAEKLERIDKWGKTLTVITVVFGVLLGAAWIYQTWIQGAQIPTGA